MNLILFLLFVFFELTVCRKFLLSSVCAKNAKTRTALALPLVAFQEDGQLTADVFDSVVQMEQFGTVNFTESAAVFHGDGGLLYSSFTFPDITMFTLSAWVKPNQFLDSEVTHGDPIVSTSFLRMGFVASSGATQFGFRCSYFKTGGGAYPYVSFDPDQVLNRWTHVTCSIRDGNKIVIELRRADDGLTPFATQDLTLATESVSVPQEPVYVGMHRVTSPSGATTHFSGMVRSVYMFTESLPASDVQRVFVDGCPLVPAPEPTPLLSVLTGQFCQQLGDRFELGLFVSSSSPPIPVSWLTVDASPHRRPVGNYSLDSAFLLDAGNTHVAQFSGGAHARVNRFRLADADQGSFSSITVACWLLVRQPEQQPEPGNRTVLFKSMNVQGTRVLELHVGSTQPVSNRYIVYFRVAGAEVELTSRPPYDQWVYLVCWLDAGRVHCQVNLDANSRTSVDFQGGGSSRGSDYAQDSLFPLYVGTHPIRPDSFFDGQLSDLFISTANFSATLVQENVYNLCPVNAWELVTAAASSTATATTAVIQSPPSRVPFPATFSSPPPTSSVQQGSPSNPRAAPTPTTSSTSTARPVDTILPVLAAASGLCFLFMLCVYILDSKKGNAASSIDSSLDLVPAVNAYETQTPLRKRSRRSSRSYNT